MLPSREKKEGALSGEGGLTAAFLPKAKYTFQTLLSHHQERMTAPERGTAGPGACRVVVIINDFRKVAGESGNRAAFIILSLDTCSCGFSLLHKCCTALCYRDFLIKASINENNIIAELIFGS